MSPCCHFFFVAVTIFTWVVQISFPSPTHEVSEAVGFISRRLDKIEFSLSSSVHPRRHSKDGATPKAYIRTPGTAPPGNIAFKSLYRGPNYEILPIHVGAQALHAFYTSISHLASTIWPRTRSQETIFTITQGALQLTMSSLGTKIPWDFVEDWSMRAAESVARGWTDTFDALYENEGTGVRIWVSLRLLERWQ